MSAWETADEARRAAASAWDEYESLINRQCEHPQTCDACRQAAGPHIAPGSLLSVYMAPCLVAAAIAEQADVAYSAWLKAHGAYYSAMRVAQVSEHRKGCGCLSCATWRAEVRATVDDRRRWPVPARDWRGQELPS